MTETEKKVYPSWMPKKYHQIYLEVGKMRDKPSFTIADIPIEGYTPQELGHGVKQLTRMGFLVRVAAAHSGHLTKYRVKYYKEVTLTRGGFNAEDSEL